MGPSSVTIARWTSAANPLECGASSPFWYWLRYSQVIGNIGPSSTIVIPIERIAAAILVIRGEKVILDADLALLYGVTTKRLNEQVKRNQMRFPEDFMFQLTKPEKDEAVANCDHLQNLKFSRVLPHAFTEHGAIMAANILNSGRAVEASVQVVRAFVRLRNLVSSQKEIAAQLAKIESHLGQHDDEIELIFKTIRQLITPPLNKTRRIGFRSKASKK